MVFESLVVDLLNRFLGDYVENLDRSQLKLGIWGGDVTLKSLDIKENALDELDLPLKVIAGHLGHLTLKIPWKNLYTAPVVATIDNVYLVAVPNVGIEYNEEKEEKAKQEVKQRELKRIEDAKEKEALKGKEVDKKDSFGEKMATQIIKNLQVKIMQIHLRYEDNFTNPLNPFAVGVTLNDLSFETTDQDWKPCVLQDAVKMIFKVVALDSLAVYWNSKCKMFSQMEPDVRKGEMKREIAASVNKPKGMSYILGPINSFARLKLNSKPEQDDSNFTIPKVGLSLVMEEIAVALTKSQYQGIMELLDSLDRLSRATAYRRFRPLLPHTGNPRIWWKFAMRCVLEEDIGRKQRNWSWLNMLNHRTLCRVYKEAYKEKLLAKKVSNQLQAQLEEYEKKLDVFNITIMRKQAEIQVAYMAQTAPKNQGGWFGWLGFGSKKETDDRSTQNEIAKKIEDAMTPGEKSKLYEAIGYQENAVPMEYPPEFVENTVDFMLHSLSVSIVDDSSAVTHVIKARLKNVRASLEQRPAAAAIKVLTSMESFTVFGSPLPQEPQRWPSLITTQSGQTSGPLLSVHFETNPEDGSCDQRLLVNSQSLQICYDAATINNLMQVLKTPESLSLQQLQAAAAMKLDDFKELSATGLQFAIERHQFLELHVDLQPSIIIIPENGIFDKIGHQIMLNLGNFKMNSFPRNVDQPTVRSLVKAGSTEQEIMTTMMSEAYDKFDIKIENVSVLLSASGEYWENLKEEGNFEYLLTPLNVSVRLEKAIVTDDPRLPKLKVVGELPLLNLKMSEQKVLHLMRIGTSIPLPEDESAPIVETLHVPTPSSVLTESAQVNARVLKQVTKAGALVEISKDVQQEETASVQMTDLELLFQIKEMSFEMTRETGPKQEQEMLTFALYNLGSRVVMHTHDMCVDVFLGGITLQHKEFKSFDGSPLYILQTPMTTGSSEQLLSVKFISANKKAPKFETAYENTLQKIVLTFSHLDVNLHQEAIVSLMEFGNNLSARIQDLQTLDSSKRKLGNSMSNLLPEPGLMKRMPSQLMVYKAKKTEKEIINMKIVAEMYSLGVMISNSQANISQAKVAGLKASVIMENSKTSVHALLKDLLVSDPRPGATYVKILSTVSGDVMNVTLDMFNDATENLNYLNMSAVDMSVTVQIGQMMVVYLNKYIAAVLGFLDQFQVAKQKMVEASAAAAQVARQGLEEAYIKATRLALDIALQAPVIIVPQNSRSPNALIADLGTLLLRNVFRLGDKRNEIGMPSMFEDMQLDLHNLKLSRGVMCPSEQRVTAECLLLEPVSFTLRVVRNLTIDWHKEAPELDLSGTLAAVCLSASQEDYVTVMRMLSENLCEASDIIYVASTDASDPRSGVVIEAEAHLEVVTPSSPVAKSADFLSPDYKRVKFNFVIESFCGVLYEGSSNLDTGVVSRQAAQSLASVELKTMAVTGEMLGDSSLWANVILVNCMLNDTRSSRKEGVKRLMESTASSSANYTSNSMIDVTFRQDSAQNTFMDVKVNSFTLIVCLEYMLTLGQFFSVPQEDKALVTSALESTGSKSSSHQKAVAAPKKSGEEPTTTIQLTLLKPDIVLIENIEDINSNAVIFNNEVSLKIKMNSEMQYVSGSISALELFTAQYNPEFRDASMQQILNPCDISLLYKSTIDDGQRINVGVNEFVFHVNPATVQLLTNILSALSTPQSPSKEVSISKPQEDLSLWTPKSLEDCNFWYLKTNEPKSALEVTEDFTIVEIKPSATPTCVEQMILEVKNILVTVEAGFGKSVVPLILLESSFHAEVLDWTSKLKVDAHLVLEMAYFNEKLAVWEPLVEPVEQDKGHRAWELTAKVTKNEEIVDSGPDTVDSPSEEVIFQPPLMSIQVISNDPLQLTITKVALDVITNLSKAFGEAVSSSKSLKVEKPKAPYIVRNELGLKMNLLLEDSLFQVCGHDGDYKDVVLEPGTSVDLHLRDSGKVIAHPGLALMRREDRRMDYFFNIKIETDEISCIRTVYLMRTDKRYYDLPLKTYPGDHWGFIVSVTSEGGAKIISLQSVVQIVNHFKNPIEVFYVRPNGTELLESCGIVDRDSPLHVPSYALYTAKNELFFKPYESTYSMTSQPFVWKDLLKEPTFGMGLICEHKEKKKEKFFIQVAGEMEQVLYEHTSKKTMMSAGHRLHLSPPALIRNLLPFPISYAVQNVNEEIVLREGQSSEITSAEIGGHGLEIKLKNYLDRDWRSFNTLEALSQELRIWTFTAAQEDRKISLELGVRTEKIHNSLVFSLYCPFWMINRTGLQLTYRSDESNVICHPPEVEIPVLFSFRAKSFFSKKKASIKIEDSEWSEKFGLDVIGNSGTVLAKSRDGRNYGVGVQIKLSNSGLTKLVIFTPYCILVNNTPRAIQCKETAEASTWVTIPAQNCKPFWARDKNSEIVACYVGSQVQTEPFSFRQEHVTLLKLNDSRGGLNVECRMSEGSGIMAFSEYFNGSASVLLVNHTDCTLEYGQKGVEQRLSLGPEQAVLYTWQKPTGHRELLWSCGLTVHQANSLSSDGLGEFFANSDTKVYWVSLLDGMQRVLFFTQDVLLATNAKAGELERLQQEFTISLDSIGVSLVNNLTNAELLYLCIASTGVIWEGRKMKASRFKALSLKDSQLIEAAYEIWQREKLQGKDPKARMVLDGRIDLDFDTELMFKPHKRCLRRSFQTGLWAQYSTSPHQVQVHAKIHKMQIDNQLQDYVFPVVMAPVPLPKSVAQESIPKPFVEVSIVQTIHEHSTVVQYKYFKCLIQEFHIKLDQGFLNAVLEFFQAEQVIQKDYVELLEKDKREVSLDLKALASDYFSQEQKSFYDDLHLSPLKVHLSFSMTGSSDQDANSPTAIHSEFLNLLLQSIGVTLTEVQDVIFRFNYFERSNAFMNQTQFMNAVISHYSSQAIKQFYVLLLGLDVIGNPVGLLLGITSGVEDLFYEPIKGAIQGPEEFAEGLVLGVRSLFGHTVGGAAGAVSRITGTLGKGIAALTMDKEYQKKRRQEMNRRPQGITQGLAQGGKGLLMGVYDGVTGVVTKPWAGAKAEGFSGFAKGVGKGLIGVVARPTAGVVDFASGSLDVVKKAVDMSDDVKRMRLPRFIQPDGVIRPYRTFEAEGLKLLLDVEKGKYASTDSYVAHVPVGNDRRSYLMVTTQRVIYVTKGDMFGQWNNEWNYTWGEVKDVPVVMEKGIQIMLKEHKKKKRMSFFGGVESGKIVAIKDPVLCNWIVGKMEETMRYLLQERRDSNKAVTEAEEA